MRLRYCCQDWWVCHDHLALELRLVSWISQREGEEGDIFTVCLGGRDGHYNNVAFEGSLMKPGP
jgi:hypothetical protein